jgi:protein kinase C substrate 80K-H
LDAALTEARNTRDAAKREIEEINKFFGLDFGPDDAFYGNYGETYEYTTHEYTYELKMFQSVFQRQSGRHTRMGDWEAWKSADKSSQMYSKGEHCWGGPDRSCKVVIRCGPEPRVLGVKEPAKCEYEMEFETPAACNPEMVKTL